MKDPNVYRRIVENLALPIFLLDIQVEGDFIFSGCNPAYERATQLRQMDLKGKPLGELPGQLKATVPALREHSQRCVQTGEVVEYEEKWASNTHESWWLTQLSPVFSKEGKVHQLIGSHTKMTESKAQRNQVEQANTRIQALTRLYATLSQVNQAVVRVKEGQTLFEQVCAVAVDTGQFPLAWIGLLENVPFEITPVAHAGDEETFQQQVIARSNPLFTETIKKALHTEKVSILHAAVSGQAVVSSSGYPSMAAIPFRLREKNLGILCLYASETNFFNPEEQALLEEISIDISFALEAMGMERERQQAETALALKEMELRNLAESSPGLMGLFYLRPDGTACMPYVSPSIWDLFGLRPEDVVDDATPLLARTHPDDMERVNTSIAESARTLTPWHLEYRVIHPTRGELWLEGSTNPKPHPDGGIIWYGFVHDITERKRAEQELRASEVRFRTLVNHAADAFFLHNEQGIVLDVNQQAGESLGYTREELIGMSPSEFDAALDLTSMGQIPARLAAGEILVFDTLHRRKDGTTFPVEVRARAFEQGGGNLSISLARDMTERKRAEMDLQRSNDLLRAIIEAAPTAIIGLDLDGNVQTVWNLAAERMLGWQAHEVMGHPLPTVSTEKQEEFRQFREQIRKGLTLNGVEVRRQKRDGTPIEYSIYASPLYNAEQQITGNIAVLVDITERKQAEALLHQREQEFRALVENSPDYIGRYDREARLVYANPAVVKMSGGPLSAITGKTPVELSPTIQEAQDIMDKIKQVLETGLPLETEIIIQNTPEKGTVCHFARFFPEFDQAGQVASVLFVGQDITERKQAEQAFRETHEKYVALVNSIDGIVWECDAQNFQFTFVSQQAEHLLGYPIERWLAEPTFWRDHIHPDDREWAVNYCVECTLAKRQHEFEYRMLAADGRILWIRDIVTVVVEDDRPVLLRGIMMDNTQRRQAEAERQAHLHFLESLDQVNRAIQGTNDLEQMMKDLLDALLAVFASDRAYLVYPCDPESPTWQVPMERNRPEYPGTLPLGKELPLDPHGAAVFRMLIETGKPVIFGPGSEHPVPEIMKQTFGIQSFITMAIFPKIGKPWAFGLHQCSYARVWDVEEERLLQEIGWRMADALTSFLAHRDLRKSEQKYREIFDNVSDALFVFDITEDQQFRFTSINAVAEKIAGFSNADAFGKFLEEMLPPAQPASYLPYFHRCIETGELVEYESEDLHFQLGGRYFHTTLVPVKDHTGSVRRLIAVSLDITERKLAEDALLAKTQELEALFTLSAHLRTAQTEEEILGLATQAMKREMKADATNIVLFDRAKQQFTIVHADGALASNVGTVFDIHQGISSIVYQTRKPYFIQDYPSHPQSLPGLAGVEEYGPSVFVPLQSEGQFLGVLVASRKKGPEGHPFTEEAARLLTTIGEMIGNSLQRMWLYEQALIRLRHLQALQTIDTTILSSLDQNLTFGIIINEVITNTGVDAAAILLLDPASFTLAYAAGQGFRTPFVQETQLQLGKGYAGKVAFERRALSISNLSEIHEPFETQLAQEESFVAYYAIPMITKGKVSGVLEIYHRRPLELGSELENFLKALANQAAIAIDNAQLFNELQHTNLELIMAYDQTIEGWSRALDLRDKETEGHTQRVTDLTMRLARSLGLSGEALVHIRRGALLHDIGKMGIPDQILLKPGKLTPEEWETMHKHPTYAYELLYPIQYLRPALDIPYCHHEKWDGTGYPRGLFREQIPLAARIFALADVWDALRSDRPYRQSWPEEKVREHIHSLSESHFDPTLVPVFLRLVI